MGNVACNTHKIIHCTVDSNILPSVFRNYFVYNMTLHIDEKTTDLTGTHSKNFFFHFRSDFHLYLKYL